MKMCRSKRMIYDTLAKYYDILVKDDEATRMYVDWIESFEPKKRVLELACGSGEITHQLAQDGYMIDALDLSEEMIAAAEKKDKERQIAFYAQDMRDLSNLKTYDLIVCVCDSFNYLLEKDEVSRFFKQVADHLGEGGLFCFDTHSLDRIEEFEGEYNETGEFEDGVQYQWSIMSEDDLVYQDFAFYMPDGTILQEHHMQKVYDPQFLIDELEKHFEIVSITTDFEQEGIKAGEKYFFAARKK